MLLLTLNMNMFNFVIDDSFNDYFDSISTDIAFLCVHLEYLFLLTSKMPFSVT
jgi:hypothetical protein